MFLWWKRCSSCDLTGPVWYLKVVQWTQCGRSIERTNKSTWGVFGCTPNLMFTLVINAWQMYIQQYCTGFICSTPIVSIYPHHEQMKGLLFLIFIFHPLLTWPSLKRCFLVQSQYSNVFILHGYFFSTVWTNYLFYVTASSPSSQDMKR